MEDQRQRLTTCISTPELQRRWDAVRQQMKQRKLDYLVMQTSEEYLGGTARWFTDFSARHQFPYTVIFPVDDDMTTIVCGFEAPSDDNYPWCWASRGIKRHLGDVYFPTHEFTNDYEGKLAVSVLSERKKPRIGWVEKAFIPVTFYEYVTKNLPDATFENATSWVDELRVPKSPEEIHLIRGTAAIQDACMEALKKIIQPGMRDMDVYAEIHCFLAKHGKERGLVQVNSGPLGTMVPFDVPHFQNRTIKDGDQITILIETNGPGGYYTEILRVLTLGKRPTQALADTFGSAVEAMEMTARNLVPGADPKTLWNDYKEFITKRGCFAPRRSFCHGQGLSLVDRPSIRPEEPWKIGPNWNIAVHPYAVKENVWTIVGDNYMTTEGKPERLHKFPAEITVI